MEVPAVQTAFLLDIGVKANLQTVTQVCHTIALRQDLQYRNSHAGAKRHASEAAYTLPLGIADSC